MEIDKKKCAVFVDGNNIEQGARSIYGDECAVNYDALVPMLVGDRSLYRFAYFREGYTISKLLEERFRNKFGGEVMACGKSADMWLAMDAVRFSDRIDIAIIVSGDGDYVPLIKYLQTKGVGVEICYADVSSASQLSIRNADVSSQLNKRCVYNIKKIKNNCNKND